MAKRTASEGRERVVSLRLTPEEFQLVTYAASKSRTRGHLVWMRERLLEAARARLSDQVAERILKGEATSALLKESLAEARKARRSGRGTVVPFRPGRKR